MRSTSIQRLFKHPSKSYQNTTLNSAKPRSLKPPPYGINAADNLTPLQAKFGTYPNYSQGLQRRTNSSLPERLKTNMEQMGGVNLNDVKVNYNSPKPRQIGALAYTRGNQIELGPGQEKHLPHEAWHAVQQKQGRVQPTTTLAKGLPLNNDAKLEREADVMGRKGQRQAMNDFSIKANNLSRNTPSVAQTKPSKTLQRRKDEGKTVRRERNARFFSLKGKLIGNLRGSFTHGLYFIHSQLYQAVHNAINKMSKPSNSIEHQERLNTLAYWLDYYSSAFIGANTMRSLRAIHVKSKKEGQERGGVLIIDKNGEVVPIDLSDGVTRGKDFMNWSPAGYSFRLYDTKINTLGTFHTHWEDHPNEINPSGGDTTTKKEDLWNPNHLVDFKGQIYYKRQGKEYRGGKPAIVVHNKGITIYGTIEQVIVPNSDPSLKKVWELTDYSKRQTFQELFSDTKIFNSSLD